MKIHIVCFAISCFTPLINASSTFSTHSLSNTALPSTQHLFKRKVKKSKNSPKIKTHSTPLTVDDEMDYLNQQINDNDIRSHYNFELLETEQYLPTLNKALTYANGMLKGVHFEVEGLLQSETYLSKYVHTVRTLKKGEIECPNLELLNTELGLNRMIEKATSTRSIWYIYSVALKNLITYNSPHSEFYELFVNVFLEIELVLVHEFINNFGIHSIRKLILQKIAGLKQSGSEIDPDLIRHTEIIISVMDFLNKIIDIDILAADFGVHLAKAIDDSIELLELEHDFAEGNLMFVNAAELLSKLQFINIILPLVKSNRKFVEKLSEMRYIRPKLDSFKRGDSSESLNQILKDFHGTVKARFLSEWYQIYDMSQDLVTDYSTFVFLNENIVQRDTNLKIKNYKEDMITLLNKVNNTLFFPNSPSFRNVDENTSHNQEKKLHELTKSHEVVEELFNYEQLNATPHTHHRITIKNQHELKTDSSTGHSKSKVRHNHSQTLNTLLNGDQSTGLKELKWSDVSDLIVTVGGYVEKIGGGINMLFIPGEFSFPVRFDQPIPFDSLGIDKAMVLRRIFEMWGITSTSE